MKVLGLWGYIWIMYQSLQWMELGWEEGHQEADCYQAEDENKKIIMKDRKDSVTHLPESLTNVAIKDSG